MIDLYRRYRQRPARLSHLEESGLPIARTRSIREGEQRSPVPEAQSCGLIPVIVDHEGPSGRPLTLSQSGAILLVAERWQFARKDAGRRAVALQWLIRAASDVAGASNAAFTSTPGRRKGFANWITSRSVCSTSSRYLTAGSRTVSSSR